MGNVESEILKKYDIAIWNNINLINSYRTKNISVIIITFITLIEFISDFLNNKRGLWQINYGYVLLFYTHIIVVVVLSFLVLFYYIFKSDSNILFHKYYNIVFSIFVLNLSAYISGWVDQMIHGQITVYAIACFGISVSFYIKRKYIILIYLQSYIAFILYLSLIQENYEVLRSNCLNSLLFIVLACFVAITISKFMENDNLYKHRLEELVKTRSDTLLVQQQTINRLQHLNLIGELSAGIAHEVRNPMTSVRGFLQLLGNKDYNKKDKEYFDLMIDEIDRANSIITDFLGFSKDKKIDYEDKDLNHIILKLVPLLDTNLLYEITTDLGKIPRLFLDEKEISQVILNLANNGFESMPFGGCLTIRTYKLNDKVILEIQDQGQGITPDIMAKIGTPFFTTKEKGTGLGLAVCSSIINQHNAKLDIKTDSHGSNFRVIFNITL